MRITDQKIVDYAILFEYCVELMQNLRITLCFQVAEEAPSNLWRLKRGCIIAISVIRHLNSYN